MLKLVTALCAKIIAINLCLIRLNRQKRVYARLSMSAMTPTKIATMGTYLSWKIFVNLRIRR